MRRAEANATGAVAGAVRSVRRSARLERLRARAPRYLAMGVLAVTSAIGLREIVLPERPAPAPKPADVNVDQAAEDFAVEFTRAYLTYDAARPQVRERGLSRFVPEELDVDAGFVANRGSQTVLWAEVAQNQEALAGGRVIAVAAQTDRQPEPVYLGVTVARDRAGNLVLGGYPALMGPPATNTGAELPTREPVEDGEVLQVARRVVKNYLAGEGADLEADLADSAVVTLPTVRLRVVGTEEVVWTGGPGSGAALATVLAVDGRGGEYTLTYELGLLDRGRPLVSFIHTVPTET